MSKYVSNNDLVFKAWDYALSRDEITTLFKKYYLKFLRKKKLNKILNE